MSRHIERVWDESFQVYSARHVWRQLLHDGVTVARCTVESLMRRIGVHGVMRGKPVKTTLSDKDAPCPLDHINRQFRAERPNALSVPDFTDVSTWRGFVYVAFGTDVFSRHIVGWKVSILPAPTSCWIRWNKLYLYVRQTASQDGLINPSDRGVQYASIHYTERLAEPGIEPRWAVCATPTITPWPRSSTGCTTPR